MKFANFINLFLFSCRFILGGDQGKLRYGPAKGYSAIYEASQGALEITPCFNFGDLNKNILYGPLADLVDVAFVPTPIDLSNVILPQSIESLHEKLAENMHELWAMNKIENGWTYGEVWWVYPVEGPSLQVP